MYYPAAGVMLAYLAARRPSLPRALLCLLPAQYGGARRQLPGAVLAPGDVWLAAANLIVVAGSALAWVFLLTERKEKRAAAGLRWHGGVKALGFVALFILLRTAAVFLSMLPYGQLGEYLAYWSTPDPYLTFLLLIPNFFLSFLPFFGEEYGWRYYLQPRLQQRFGPRGGVLALGLVWAAWHLPLNFFYYAPETGLQSFASQIITCVVMAVFFGWAYMKTQNIWVPVLLHCFNNSLILVYSGTAVVSNQTVTWFDILVQLIVYGVIFLPFLASGVFRKARPAEK